MTKRYKLLDVLQVVNLPKSVYFYWMNQMKKENPDKEIEEIIQSVFEENHGNYGYRRIHLTLRNRGYFVNHKKVSRIMRKLGIQCVKFFHKSRKYRSYKGDVGKVAENRIRRRFSTPIAYQKLATDITEFQYGNGQKLYLNPMMDLFNREILSFEIGKRPNLAFVMKPLERALARIRGAKYRTTIHSDQGWHYQHAKWVRLLKENKIFQSMSRKGNCLDNSPMENFFGLLKQEIYFGVKYETYEQLKTAIDQYIYYYNHKRIKQKLAGMSPVQYRIHSNQYIA